MTGRRKKSGRRSAASSTRRLSRRPPTFFIDECLGGHHLAAVLTAEGVDVKLARSEFSAGTPDAVWLPVVGQRGWVVLTKDRHIQRRELEIQALVRARVRAFVLTAADLTGAEQAAVFVRALSAAPVAAAHGGGYRLPAGSRSARRAPARMFSRP